MRNIARTCRCPDVQARVCRRRIKDRQTYPAPLRAGGLAKRLWSAGLPSGGNGGRQNWKNQSCRETNCAASVGTTGRANEKPWEREAALTTSNIALARGARAGSGEVGADPFALGREALRDL